MKKKLLSGFIASTMLIGLLAGCGAASSEASSANANTISVWVPPYASSDAQVNDQDFWNAQFDAFEQANNCTVKVEIIPWDGYIQKITTGLTSGDGPDVLYIDTPYDLAQSGALEPLDEYFTQQEKDNFIYWDLGKIADKQYVAPMLVGNANILYCNMDMLNAAGIQKVPTTWDEFMDACLAIKETGVQPFLQSWGATGKGMLMTGFFPYFWQSGGEFLDEQGKPNINNAYGLKTLEFLKSFMDQGIFDESITAVDDIKTLFRDGKVAMYVGDTGSARLNTQAGINWDFTPALIGTDGVQATWIAADSLAIASNSKNKQLAVEAMKYMLSAPVMDVFHEQMYAMCPITKDAKFYDDERFQTMYTEQAEIFRNWPAFKSSDAFYDILIKNIQSMFMKDLTPQEVLDETMAQYEAQLG